MPLDLDPKPLVVAEEMNTTTRSGAFPRLWLAARTTTTSSRWRRRLVAEGSHMLDVCCAIVGEDENGYMDHVMEKIATRVPAPVLVDSTEANVIETALKRIPGKAIINSINLEDGEKRTSKVLPMAKRYGAAVIALTIDEDGMALTADKKVADREAHLPIGNGEVWHSAGGHYLRCADAADLHRTGRLPHGRHRDAERGPADQGRAAGS